MYYRMMPVLTVMVVVCCLVWALASSVGGQRIGVGGFSPIFFGGSSWSHGGAYHGSFGSGGGSIAPSGGSSGRSPAHSFSGGGTTGGHGGK